MLQNKFKGLRIFLGLSLFFIQQFSNAATSSSIKQISVGNLHSAAVLTDGTLWTWGTNSWGELGTSATISNVPQFVGGGYISTVASDQYTIALKNDGSLWGWGNNNNHEIDSTRINYRTPKQIGEGFNKIASNTNHSIALKNNGNVWVWGSTIPGNGSYYVRTDPIQITSGFIAIAATQVSYAGIKSDGSLWTWGAGQVGELGTGSSTGESLIPNKIGDGFIDIKAGVAHYLALKSDGSLWAWGYNNEGQLGLGSKVDVPRPTLVGTNFSKISAGGYASAGIKKDGSLWIWGVRVYLNNNSPTTEATISPRRFADGFVDVAVGSSVGFGVKADGSLWAWGFGGLSGKLGLGSSLYSEQPTKVEFIRPPDATAPTIPLFIKADLSNESSNIKISWSESTDDVGVKDYKISRNGQLIGRTTTLNFLDTSAASNMRYIYGISACDSAANCSSEVYSNEISIPPNPSFEASANCLFSWATVSFPELFNQSTLIPIDIGPYFVQEFAGSHAYLGANRETSHFYYLGPATENMLADLGSITDWLHAANCPR